MMCRAAGIPTAGLDGPSGQGWRHPPLLRLHGGDHDVCSLPRRRKPAARGLTTTRRVGSQPLFCGMRGCRRWRFHRAAPDRRSAPPHSPASSGRAIRRGGAREQGAGERSDTFQGDVRSGGPGGRSPKARRARNGAAGAARPRGPALRGALEELCRARPRAPVKWRVEGGSDGDSELRRGADLATWLVPVVGALHLHAHVPPRPHGGRPQRGPGRRATSRTLRAGAG
jgi:hypothetical protein